MRRAVRCIALAAWLTGAAHAEDPVHAGNVARVMADVGLPSFGFGTVTQTAAVHGALAAQSDRYESGKALRAGHTRPARGAGRGRHTAVFDPARRFEGALQRRHDGGVW